MAENFDYPAWPFAVRAWVACFGLKAVEGRLNLARAAISVREGEPFWAGNVRYALMEFLKRGKGELSGLEAQVEELRECGPIIDRRRYNLLTVYERFLFTVGRFPYRNELVRMVETAENEEHGKVTPKQIKDEATSLGLILAKSDDVGKFMKWLSEQEIAALSHQELVDRWDEHPRAYVPMAYRSPDLLCHDFLQEFYQESDTKHEQKVKQDGPSLKLTLADVGHDYRKYAKRMPTESGRRLFEEKAKLIEFTYQPWDCINDLPPYPRRLTTDVANWPTEPSNKRSVVVELEL